MMTPVEHAALKDQTQELNKGRAILQECLSELKTKLEESLEREATLRRENAELRKSLNGLKRTLSEAFNSGDGTYKP